VIWRLTKSRRTRAEDFGVRQELGVDFEADDGFVVHMFIVLLLKKTKEELLPNALV
jgi:hypothetical protein